MSTVGELLIEKNVRVYVAATGAGAGIQDNLWETPGASAYLVGACFPYAPEELEDFIGYKPVGSCTKEVAIDMAIASYVRASRKLPVGSKAIGVGVTAAVATNRERKGEDRVHIALVSSLGTHYETKTFDKGWDRENAGCEVDTLTIRAIAALLNVGKPDDISPDVLTQIYSRPVFYKDGRRRQVKDIEGKVTLFPGNFNPPHVGHMEVTDEHTMFQLTAAPPHKASLTPWEILDRVRDLRGKRDLLVLEGCPLYIDKARLFPNSTLIIGVDAVERMMDPKWGINRHELVSELLSLGVHVKVAGRKGKTIEDLRHLVPDHWEEVPLGDHHTINSTDIRAALTTK